MSYLSSPGGGGPAVPPAIGGPITGGTNNAVLFVSPAGIINEILPGANGEVLTIVAGVPTYTAGVRKFYIQQALAAGANVINHNLALATPEAVTVQVRNNLTGDEVALPITSYAANTLTLTALAPVATVDITVIG